MKQHPIQKRGEVCQETWNQKGTPANIILYWIVWPGSGVSIAPWFTLTRIRFWDYSLIIEHRKQSTKDYLWTTVLKINMKILLVAVAVTFFIMCIMHFNMTVAQFVLDWQCCLQLSSVDAFPLSANSSLGIVVMAVWFKFLRFGSCDVQMYCLLNFES